MKNVDERHPHRVQRNVRVAILTIILRILAACTAAAAAALVLALAVPGAVGSRFASTPNFLPEMFQRWPTPTATPLPGYLLITEVMYDPDRNEPGAEWVEIYNPGSTAVDLHYHKLGDEETLGGPEGMFQFPPGAVLAPGEVIIVANQTVAFYEVFKLLPDYEMYESHPFIPNMLKYAAWTGGNVELSNGGDEVLLLDMQDERVDALSWGDSSFELDPPIEKVQQGHSLERLPADIDTNSANDWSDQELPTPGKVDLSRPTPTATVIIGGTPTPQGPLNLLVSEVVYDPPGVDPDGEWFEIYNYGGGAASLEGVRIGDEETQGGGEGMLAFPVGAIIAPGQALVVANQAVVVSSTFGINPDYEVYDSDPSIPQMLRDTGWGSGAVNLGNSGDELILLDWNGSILDALSWGDSTFAFDPPVQLVSTGHSLERYPPGSDTDRASDWRDQPAPSPKQVDLVPPTPTPTATATPAPLSGVVINELHADPDPAQGDANGDGVINIYDDEFIEIVNTAGIPLDFSNASLNDAQGLRHTFPPGSVVGDGCVILVFGGGTPAGGFGGSLVQVASSGMLGMNNAGDTLTLYDSTGVEIAAYTYGTEGGDNQSLTRSPDISGPDPLVKHSVAAGSGGALFSPGTGVDGTMFPGCAGPNR